MSPLLYEKGIRALFAGGGTAGHIVPAINIAVRLKERYPGSTIFFAGTQAGMESVLVPRHNFSFLPIKAYPFRGGLFRSINFLLKFPSAVLEALSVIRGTAPEIVVGTGGYVSVPVVFAASILRIPTLIQVQNVVPGFASIFLSFLVDEINVGFPGAKGRFFWRSSKKVLVSGNPVNTKPPEKIKEQIINEMNLHQDYFTILVTGGSQGAKVINRVVLALAKGRYLPDGFQIIWQTGEANYEEIAKEQESFTLPVYLTPFIENMNEAYYISSLVICRAGALTLSEIACWGLPSIVIPYELAGRHQYMNARYFEKMGASTIIKEKDLSANNLAKEIIKICNNEQKRLTMIRAARRIARENATDFVVDRIVDLVFKRR